MKEQIATLHAGSAVLKGELDSLIGDNNLLATQVASLTNENSSLKQDIASLQLVVDQLQQSENEVKAQIANLQSRAETPDNDEITSQLNKLRELQLSLANDIAGLHSRLAAIEGSLKQAPVSGIFAYIESEEQRNLFIEKVEEALSQEMTYAQIDDFLTANLPKELDDIVKAHPALTKNYIRNLRRD